MKIIVDNKIPFIKGRLEGVAETVYADISDFTPESVSDADALIIRTRTRCDEHLLKNSQVSLITTATIGLDHIDVEWCGSRSIEVCNAAGCNAPGVAQYVWSSLLRHGFNPEKDKLGVVGCGHIGSIVIAMARQLGVTTLVCDPPRKDAGLTDYDYRPLEELLCDCDAVTLHTPLTHDGKYPTFHLIGESRLLMMKPESILVNASRGEVVDNAAWLRHLNAHTGAKAIIDVWENEPDINGELLKKAIVATPHIAGYSLEGKQRATRMALESVERHFGVKVDKSGLCEDFNPATMNVTAADIIASYNPESDTRHLKERPEAFEELRGNYNYRKEI